MKTCSRISYIRESMVRLEPHFLAAVVAADAACSVLEVMPDVDLVEDLRNLIYIQHDLMMHIIEGKHYGTDNITSFIEFAQDVQEEMARLGE